MTVYADLTQSERKEVDRLSRRHRDIAELGVGALEKQREREAKQQERQDWVTRHSLACFRCGAKAAQWAGGGRNRWGRLYVICVLCVRRPR